MMVRGWELANVEQSGRLPGSTPPFAIYWYAVILRGVLLSLEARMVRPLRSNVIDPPHPFGGNSKAIFETVSVLMTKIPDRFGDIHKFVARRQDLRIPILGQRRRRSSHLQHRVGEFLDGVMMTPSDVVRFSRLKIIDDVRYGPHGIGQESRSARMASKHGPRQPI